MIAGSFRILQETHPESLSLSLVLITRAGRSTDHAHWAIANLQHLTAAVTRLNTTNALCLYIMACLRVDKVRVGVCSLTRWYQLTSSSSRNTYALILPTSLLNISGLSRIQVHIYGNIAVIGSTPGEKHVHPSYEHSLSSRPWPERED
jgi:hypothetical protein